MSTIVSPLFLLVAQSFPIRQWIIGPLEEAHMVFHTRIHALIEDRNRRASDLSGQVDLAGQWLNAVAIEGSDPALIPLRNVLVFQKNAAMGTDAVGLARAEQKIETNFPGPDLPSYTR